MWRQRVRAVEKERGMGRRERVRDWGEGERGEGGEGEMKDRPLT